MSSTIWLARDASTGFMQYVVYGREPKRTERGFSGGVCVAVANEIATQMIDRELKVGECVEIVTTEVAA